MRGPRSRWSGFGTHRWVAAGSLPGHGPNLNTGLIHHDGRLHPFVRSVRNCYRRNQGPGDTFLNCISDVLAFNSGDGWPLRVPASTGRECPGGVHSYEDHRVQRVKSGRDDHVVMTCTKPAHGGVRPPWRVGLHRLDYRDGASASSTARTALDAAAGSRKKLASGSRRGS